MAVNLLDVPPELLDQVFAHLDTTDICRSVRVCKLFHVAAEPYLYRDIKLLRGSQAEALVYAFSQSPARVRCVRSLLVSTKFGDDYGLHALPPWLIEV